MQAQMNIPEGVLSTMTNTAGTTGSAPNSPFGAKTGILTSSTNSPKLNSSLGNNGGLGLPFDKENSPSPHIGSPAAVDTAKAKATGEPDTRHTPVRKERRKSGGGSGKKSGSNTPSSQMSMKQQREHHFRNVLGKRSAIKRGSSFLSSPGKSAPGTPPQSLAATAATSFSFTTPTNASGDSVGVTPDKWRSVFNTRVNAAVLSLDDVMKSMEAQLESLETKKTDSPMKGSNASAIENIHEDCIKAKVALQGEITRLEEELTLAKSDAASVAETNVELTHQINVRMEAIHHLEEQLAARGKTMSEYEGRLQSLKSQLEHAMDEKTTEDYKRATRKLLKAELTTEFEKRGMLPATELDEVRAELELMKMQCFLSTALSIKLSYSLAGTPTNNVNVQELWDMAVEQEIPSRQWASWVGSQVVTITGAIETTTDIDMVPRPPVYNSPMRIQN